MSAFETDIIFICYRQAAFIRAALDSIFNQTCQSFRVLAVDDGSNDGSLEILREFEAHHPGRMVVFTHDDGQNLGPAGSYRLALSHVAAPFVAFLEGDDIWRPSNLEKKIHALKNSDAGVVFSSFEPFGDTGLSLYWKIHRAINAVGVPKQRLFNNGTALLERNNVASFSHFVVRRELLEGLEIPQEYEDRLDWWVLAHLSRKSGFYFMPEKLCRWRVQRGSLSQRKWNRGEIKKLQRFLAELRTSLNENGREFISPFYKLRFMAHCFLKNLFT